MIKYVIRKALNELSVSECTARSTRCEVGAESACHLLLILSVMYLLLLGRGFVGMQAHPLGSVRVGDHDFYGSPTRGMARTPAPAGTPRTGVETNAAP